MLRRLVSLVDPKGLPGRASARPAAGDDVTDPWTRPWDVRTLIAPFPGGGPIDLVFANAILGRVPVLGLGDPGAPADGAGFAVVVAGPGRREARRFDFAPGERRVEAGALRLENREARYELTGAWPSYRARLETTAAAGAGAGALAFDLALDCASPLHHWAGRPALYSHWSGFGTARGAALGAPVAGGVSLEHGGGAAVPGGLAVPAHRFHYEVVRLDGGDQCAFVALSLAPGLELIRRGVYHVASGRVAYFPDYRAAVEETSAAAPRAPAIGAPIPVPRRWSVEARSHDGAVSLRYEAETTAAPFTGAGRLTSTPTRVRAEVREGEGDARRAAGKGYLEFTGL